MDLGDLHDSTEVSDETGINLKYSVGIYKFSSSSTSEFQVLSTHV